MNILVTGGAGFIGSNFLLRMTRREGEHLFVNVDNLGYAGNLYSLSEISTAPNYAFEHADIRDAEAMNALFEKYRPQCVIHFAAESHVDRSIVGPGAFIQTNIVGTFNLLETCRAHWKPDELADCVFHHISTDEVYGSLGPEGAFTEQSRYDPSSPYSASKAASDHLVRAYGRTYGLPVKMTNCSNNYGPRQFPEKLVPLMILNAYESVPLPVYGQGLNVRDWLYVDDHCDAIWEVVQRGRVGETYNVGGAAERANLDVVRTICRLVAEATGRDTQQVESLITFVTDRPGHDLRYAIDATKIHDELGWSPRESFDSGLRKTVEWYLGNMDWVERIRCGEYRQWLTKNYEQR